VSEPVSSSAVVLALALARAERTAEGYELLASAFEVANNLAATAVFQELAEGSWTYVASFPAATVAPPPLSEWTQPAGEISDADAVHYLMPPYYAFDLALRHEKASLALLEGFAGSPHAEVRSAAADIARRQQDRVDMVLALRDSHPKPPPGWWIDEDGPNFQGD